MFSSFLCVCVAHRSMIADLEKYTDDTAIDLDSLRVNERVLFVFVVCCVVVVVVVVSLLLLLVVVVVVVLVQLSLHTNNHSKTSLLQHLCFSHTGGHGLLRSTGFIHAACAAPQRKHQVVDARRH